jgi:hypothetical protein
MIFRSCIHVYKRLQDLTPLYIQRTENVEISPERTGLDQPLIVDIPTLVRLAISYFPRPGDHLMMETHQPSSPIQ